MVILPTYTSKAMANVDNLLMLMRRIKIGMSIVIILNDEQGTADNQRSA